MKSYLKLYFTGLAFLSRLPIPANWQSFEDEDFAQIPKVFWLVGLTLGVLIASAGCLLGWLFPTMVAMAVLSGLQILLTGAFHEDGFADLADSVGASTVEKRFEIMADSRLGTFGVSALISLLLIRITCYLFLVETFGWGFCASAIIVVSGWNRWVSVVLMKLLPYVHSSSKGVGKSMVLPTPGGLIVVGFGLSIFTAFLGFQYLLAVLIAVVATLAFAKWFFKKWLGGVNGDCLGATTILAEILMLLAFCL